MDSNSNYMLHVPNFIIFFVLVGANNVWEANKILPEYFFTCPNITLSTYQISKKVFGGTEL